MLKFITERSKRLHDCCSHLKNLVVTKPLLAGLKLSDSQQRQLHTYINTYLYDSLTSVGADVNMGDDLLTTATTQIKALPNITPNGLLLPKRHNLISYNLLLGHLTNLIGWLDLRGISRLHYPVNVRIIDGAPNPTVDSRPRASVKLHSDIWAGEFTDHIMIFIPVAGDMVNNGVELYEPGADFYPDYVRTMSDYAEGADLINGATKYDVVMQPGHVYLLDSFLLHRTMKQTPGLRLVINFAYIPKQKVPSDLKIRTNRSTEYIDANDWYKLGHDTIVSTDSIMRTFDVGETAGTVQNKYADDYKIIAI